MNKHRKIIALAIAILLCIGTIVCTSAAHKDYAEISAKTGLEPVGTFSANTYLSPQGEDLPSRYNSAEEGFTLQVRQQNSDTCWAFGTLSSYETLLLKNNESNINLMAPEHANYWGAKRDDGTGWQRDPNSPGYSFIPLGYLTSWAGPVNEEDFPLNTSTEEDYKALTKTPSYGLTSAIYFDNSTDKDVIKEFILNYGSVVASFNADLDYLSNDTAYYCADSSIKTQHLYGHCVSIVGWDDNYSKDNFSGSKSGIPSNDGAWLMKNSWGEFMGDKGYMWISYEDVWVFNEIFGPSYALTDYENLCEDVKLYQNEVDGATYQFTYLDFYEFDKITYMNVFNFEEEHRTLDKVMFESTCVGADYTVYYVPMDGNTPTSERVLWTKLAKGTVSYSGYHCADFEDELLTEGKGAIAVEIDTTDVDDSTPNSIGVCEWLLNGTEYIFLPQSDFGMSYYMLDDSVRDVMDFYANDFRDDIGGTFVIKAITRNECSSPHPTEPGTSITVTEPDTTATVPASTVQTDPTEITTVPVTTTNPDVTTLPATSVPVTTTLPVPTVTVPTASETDPTETTTVTIPVTSVPVTTVTLPNTSAPLTSLTLPTETSTFDIADPFVYKLGDADLSGVVNIKDATQIQKHAARLLILTSREHMAADVNKNGDANVVDATYIQKYSASIKTDISVGQECVYFE